jgi:hypothetical protein
VKTIPVYQKPYPLPHLLGLVLYSVLNRDRPLPRVSISLEKKSKHNAGTVMVELCRANPQTIHGAHSD